MRKSFLSRLFYKSKHTKKDTSDNLTTLLLPSMLGIILCAVCLMGSTWAWFTATQSTATQTIQAANYDVSAVIKLNDTEIAADNGTYTLTQGEYTVTLTANGDATTGYCVLDFDGTKAYTEQIAKGAAITLKLEMNEPVILKITAVWGTYAGEDKITAEYTYGTASVAEEAIPPESETQPAETPTEHTVVSGDTLSSIASKYGSTVEKLAAYNGIEDVNKIKNGDVIKIPPDDYVVPETTEDEEAPPPASEAEATDPPQQTEEATEPESDETQISIATDNRDEIQE